MQNFYRRDILSELEILHIMEKQSLLRMVPLSEPIASLDQAFMSVQ